jgi:hypothetical protein
MTTTRLYLAEQIMQAVRDGHHTLREITEVVFHTRPGRREFESQQRKVASTAKRLAETGRLRSTMRVYFEPRMSRGNLKSVRRAYCYYSLPEQITSGERRSPATRG